MYSQTSGTSNPQTRMCAITDRLPHGFSLDAMRMNASILDSLEKEITVKVWERQPLKIRLKIEGLLTQQKHSTAYRTLSAEFNSVDTGS
eukprot:c28622_g3_i4 orf=1127-1393(-)